MFQISSLLLRTTTTTAAVTLSSSSTPTIPNTITLVRSHPETIMRDALIKEIRGGHSQTEVPFLVSAAEDYCRSDPGQLHCPHYVEAKNSLVSCVNFHSKRMIMLPRGPMMPHIVVSNDEEDVNNGNNSSNDSHQKKMTESINNSAKLNNLKRTSRVQPEQFCGFVSKTREAPLVVGYAQMTPEESLMMMMRRGGDIKVAVASSDDDDASLKNQDYEKKIFDIVFKPDHQHIESYKIHQLIVQEVLLPIVHGAAKNNDNNNNNKNKKNGKPLAMNIKELLTMTKYHHYSPCLGFHNLIEKELCLTEHNNSFKQEEECEIASFTKPMMMMASQATTTKIRTRRKPSTWIVSTKADVWIEWMKREESNSIPELLFFGTNNNNGKNVVQQKALLSRGLLQPSIARLLTVNEETQRVSKLQCDLLERGYRISEDVMRIEKV